MRLAPSILAAVAIIASQGSAQEFTRITDGPMVNDGRYSEGSSWGDINNDDHPDLFVPHAYSDRSNLLFINNGDGTFTQVSEGPVVTDIGTSSGGSFGDFDNDGHLDLFVPNWNGLSSHLYMNNGDGTFAKVTSGQIVQDGGWSFNSSVVDYDNDGNLDIYVDNGAFTSFVESNFLYRGHGDGTFTRITSGALVNDEEHCLSSSWCDYDGDGDQDLFTANSDPFAGIPIDNFLYENNGDGTFTRITGGVVVNDGSISIGGSWGDYDNDGDFDLFVANWYGENNNLYRNDGDGAFVQITTGGIVSDGGNSVSGAWGDYDNDGDLDLFVTNDWNEDNFLYRNDGDGTFTRVTDGSIVHDGGRSNGAAWADYDNDGFLDLYVPNGQIPDQSNVLYRNNGLSGNHWLGIQCVGTASNASAIGTRVRAKASVAGPATWQLREVSGHQGFNAQESFQVEFGLGSAAVVDSLVIEWPAGSMEVYTQVAASHVYRAREGEGLEVITTAVVSEAPAGAPAGLARTRCYPNPFNPRTAIRLAIDGARAAGGGLLPGRVMIFDVHGRRVRTLTGVVVEPGRLELDWGGEDETGRALPSGTYLYSITSGATTLTGKMTLAR